MDINWEKIISKVKEKNTNTYGLLLSCKNKEVDGDVITLHYASNVIRNQMAKKENTYALRDVLMSLYYMDFQIRCVNPEGEEVDNEDFIPAPKEISSTVSDQWIQQQVNIDNRRHEYNNYLQSEQWQILRKQILDFWGHSCILCYSRNDLNVHHRTYERFGREIFSDLIPLCKSCHDKHHGVMDTIETSYYRSPF